MTRYGIIRNGEHLKLYNTKLEAEAQVEIEKEFDARAKAKGWEISEANYRIVRVKRLPW